VKFGAVTFLCEHVRASTDVHGLPGGSLHGWVAVARSTVAVGLYLDLMKRALTRTGFEDNSFSELRTTRWVRHLIEPMQRLLSRRGLKLVRRSSRPTTGRAGFAPLNAETMIGLGGLDNLQSCIEQVLADEVPGDLIETGVWRGGASIFMRAVLAAYEVTDRTVWVADSFQGLPPSTHEADVSDGFAWDTYGEFAVPVDTVRANFARYGLLDEQVRFLVGWFKDTLPDAPFSQLAVARLDGDLYESTWDAMTSLYPTLSPGGFLIVDDYKLPACAKAIQHYRDAHRITDPIRQIDLGAVFWRKSHGNVVDA
jgi:O-methyltransferase